MRDTRRQRSRMRRPAARRVALAAAALLAAAWLLPASAAAQAYNSSGGYNAGFVTFSDFNSGAPEPLALESGWIIGIQGERWWSHGWLGTRLNLAYTKRPFDSPTHDRDIGVTMADLALLLRLAPPQPGRSFAPFVSAGGGLVHYDLGDGPAITFLDADARYGGRARSRLAAAVGIGFDILTGMHWNGDPVGIRIEAVDHITRDSPFTDLNGDDHSPIHNLRIVIGLFSGFDYLLGHR